MQKHEDPNYRQTEKEKQRKYAQKKRSDKNVMITDENVPTIKNTKHTSFKNVELPQHKRVLKKHNITGTLGNKSKTSNISTKKNSEISEVQAQKSNNNSSCSQEKNKYLSTQCAKNKPNITEDNTLKNKSIKNMQQSQNFNNKKTLIININKTSKYEMGSNKIVKTKLSHKSQKEQNKGKSQRQNNISHGPMQSDHKSTTNQNKSKEQNQFQAAFKEANKSQLHTNNENQNRSGHKRSLSEESLHFDTSCSNKRR